MLSTNFCVLFLPEAVKFSSACLNNSFSTFANLEISTLSPAIAFLFNLIQLANPDNCSFKNGAVPINWLEKNISKFN